MAYFNLQNSPTTDEAFSTRKSMSGAAFLMESLLLVLFLAASLAVLTHLFTSCIAMSNESQTTTSAILVAQNAAEEFSSNPAAVAAGTTVGTGVAKNGTHQFAVLSTVQTEKSQAGVLYQAHFIIIDRTSGEEAYALDASRYVSGAI